MRADLIAMILRKDRLLAVLALAAVSAVAWTYTVFGVGMNMSALDMTGMPRDMPMPATDWNFGGSVLMFAMWWVMMVAMMVMMVAIERQRFCGARAEQFSVFGTVHHALRFPAATHMAVKADHRIGVGHHDVQIVRNHQYAATGPVSDVADQLIERHFPGKIHALYRLIEHQKIRSLDLQPCLELFDITEAAHVVPLIEQIGADHLAQFWVVVDHPDHRCSGHGSELDTSVLIVCSVRSSVAIEMDPVTAPGETVMFQSSSAQGSLHRLWAWPFR